MLTAVVIIVVSGACAVLASMYIRWSSKRGQSATIIAMLILTVGALLGAVMVGWLISRAFMSDLEDPSSSLLLRGPLGTSAEAARRAATTVPATARTRRLKSDEHVPERDADGVTGVDAELQHRMQSLANEAPTEPPPFGNDEAQSDRKPLVN